MGDDRFEDVIESLRSDLRAGKIVTRELDALAKRLETALADEAPGGLDPTQDRIMEEKAKNLREKMTVGKIVLADTADERIRTQAAAFGDRAITKRLIDEVNAFLAQCVLPAKEATLRRESLLDEQVRLAAVWDLFRAYEALLSELSTQGPAVSGEPQEDHESGG